MPAEPGERGQAEEQRHERDMAQIQAYPLDRARQIEAILAAMADGVLVFDRDGRLLHENPAAREILSPPLRAANDPRTINELGWLVNLRDELGQPLPLEQRPSARVLRGETLRGASAMDVTSSADDGCDVLLNVSGAPIRGPNGQVVGGVLILRDVTERRQLERRAHEAAQEAEARAGQLEAVLESIADGVVVFDQEGRALRENPTARELISSNPEGLGSARTAHEVLRLLNVRDERGQPLPVKETPPFRALRGETLRGASAMDLLLRALDGRDVMVNVSYAPVRDAQGQITGAVEIVRDVTERRRLEQQTREALDALLAMAEALVQAPEQAEEAPADWPAIPSLAPEAGCAQWPANETARRLVELAQRVLGGERLCLIAIDEDTGAQRPVAAIRPTADEEQAWWANVPCHRVQDYIEPALLARLRAGEVVLVNLMQPPPGIPRDLPTFREHAALVAPLRLRERLAGLLALHYNSAQRTVTAEEQALAGAVAKLATLVLERERLLHERESARATALALTETNQRMDEFLGVATHELKTPLTSTSLSVALAARRLRSLLAQVSARDSQLAGQLDSLQGLMTGAETSTERLSRLVTDLLDVSRIRAGQLELRLEPCDLAAIVRDVVEEQRRIAPTRVMHLRLPSTSLVPVVADADRIRQVVTNYLTNALKYAPEDRPVEVRVQVREGHARVAVRDEGPGLPAAEQRRIWERYHRVQGVPANTSARAGAGGGLGLGLYISRTIVERHQGTIGVRSAPGKGSTFWFALPLAGEVRRAGEGRQTA
jgi:signal transduction histidine kinase/PAS domain-containing protein